MLNITQFLISSFSNIFPSTWLAIFAFIIILNIFSLPFLYIAIKQKRRIKNKFLFLLVNKSTLNLLIQKIWINNFIFINFLNFLKINNIYFNLKIKTNFIIFLIFNFHQILLIYQLKICKKYFKHKLFFKKNTINFNTNFWCQIDIYFNN